MGFVFDLGFGGAMASFWWLVGKWTEAWVLVRVRVRIDIDTERTAF